jgi:hypothetical protein
LTRINDAQEWLRLLALVLGVRTGPIKSRITIGNAKVLMTSEAL